ncbi:MAG: hypothetical protein ACRD2Z_18810 [Thermoanaerobaculia bacterium]
MLVGATATALTLYMAWPVLRAPAERLFGSELVGRFHDPYTVMRLFEAPRAFLGIYTQPLTDWVGALFALAVDAATAYNLVVLLTFPAAALAAYALARWLGCRPAWAAVAALAFAFAPAHIAHAAYHPHVAQVQWIPLYLWAVWNACRRPGAGSWSLAAVALAAMGMANYYFGWFGAVLLPVVALAAPQPGARRRRTALALALVGGAFAVALATPLAASLRKSYGFPAADAQRYAARPEAYLLPAADHVVLGGLARAHWSRRAPGDALLEQQQGVSWALLALFLVALVARMRNADDPALTQVPALAAIAVAAGLLSLPWLPGKLLFLASPMFRALARFGFFVQIAVCLGAAIGLERLWRARARAAACLLIAVAAFEYLPAPPWRWRPLLPTEAHRALPERGLDGAVLDCLTPPHAASSVAAFVPWRLLPADPDRLDCGEPQLAGKLAALGLGHVIRDGGAAKIDGLTLLDRYADSSVWGVAAPPAPVYVARMSGFSWREVSGDRSFRWMGAEGSLTLVVRAQSPHTIVWRAELHAFPRPRDVTVRVDGEDLTVLRVPTEPTTFDVGPLTLSPGTHSLELLPGEPPAVPAALLGTGDIRPLTIALGAWSWVAG